MKHWIVILLAGLILSTPAEARRYRHHYRDDCCYASDVAAGIVGTAAGVMLANEIMGTGNHRRKPQKKVYIYEPEGKCYTIVSRKTGKITQKCVEHASEEIIYVD